MKKLVTVVAASALIAAVPAWAANPSHPTHPTHPTTKSDKGDPGKSCTARHEGYYARGTFVSGTLTPGTKADQYNGTLTVDVARANHEAPTGSQTYTLTDARVRFGKGVTAATVAPGDRVVLHGKITVLPRKCDSTGFTQVITVRDVTIKAPKKG